MVWFTELTSPLPDQLGIDANEFAVAFFSAAVVAGDRITLFDAGNLDVPTSTLKTPEVDGAI